MEVTENSISHAIGLSREGERWFKNRPIAQDLCNRFLKPEFHNENLGEGDTTGLAQG
jgi:hypothetical protein